MMENRLANPDAECPRCGATSPPTDAPLVTCAACGLTFKPHELQHPHRAHALPDPPPGITVTRTTGIVIARWPLERWIGMVLATLVTVLLVGTYYAIAEFGFNMAVALFGVLALALAYLAAVMLINNVELVITHDELIRRYRPLPLFDSRRIPRAGLVESRYELEPATGRSHPRHWVIVAGDGPWQALALARRPDHARYLATLVAESCDLAAK